MEWAMQTVQPGFESTRNQQNETRADGCANSNEPEAAPRSARAGRPPTRPIRWHARRKAEVVEAVRRGTISITEARERYGLSIEEFLTWQHGIDLFGLAGLQVNRLQYNRPVRTRSPAQQPKEQSRSDALQQPTQNK
jgi:hypothetical protein